jgi:hypothetical protein
VRRSGDEALFNSMIEEHHLSIANIRRQQQSCDK